MNAFARFLIGAVSISVSACTVNAGSSGPINETVLPPRVVTSFAWNGLVLEGTALRTIVVRDEDFMDSLSFNARKIKDSVVYKLAGQVIITEHGVREGDSFAVVGPHEIRPNMPNGVLTYEEVELATGLTQRFEQLEAVAFNLYPFDDHRSGRGQVGATSHEVS